MLETSWSVRNERWPIRMKAPSASRMTTVIIGLRLLGSSWRFWRQKKTPPPISKNANISSVAARE